MTLRDNLYSIVGKRDEASGFAYSIRLNPQCFIYEAHFPGNPITPGVCILQVMQELLELHLGHSLSVRTINNVKYTAIMSPDEHTTIDYVFSTPTASDDAIRVKCTVQSAATVYAKISVTLQ